MPNTLHPLIRYRTIDKCFRQRGKRWNWEELAEQCGHALRELIDSEMPNPSRRTIMYDLNHMRHGKLGYYAPITYDRKEKTFYYEDPFFSIDQSPLSNEEKNELNHALVILKQFSGIKEMVGIENTIAKLEDSLRIHGGASQPAIQFDQTVNLSGLRWLDPIYQSITQLKAIELAYRPFQHDTHFTHVVSPHVLKEYNNRWFLIAWNHERQFLSNYALDRIKDISTTTEQYFRIKTFDPQIHFKDVVGVSIPVDAEVESILIAATPRQAKYINTKPIHPSQKNIGEHNGEVLFTLSLILNFELESTILSFGENVRVLEPAHLVERVQSRLSAALRNYQTIN